jgi:hypothetical protein
VPRVLQKYARRAWQLHAHTTMLGSSRIRGQVDDMSLVGLGPMKMHQGAGGFGTIFACGLNGCMGDIEVDDEVYKSRLSSRR